MLFDGEWDCPLIPLLADEIGRIAPAADLLREPQATLESVARQVGYASPYALSSAFKRLRGVSPQQYRATARTPA